MKLPRRISKRTVFYLFVLFLSNLPLIKSFSLFSADPFGINVYFGQPFQTGYLYHGGFDNRAWDFGVFWWQLFYNFLIWFVVLGILFLILKNLRAKIRKPLWFDVVILCVALLCVAFFPADSYVSMASGLHYELGCPIDGGTLTNGTTGDSDVEGWHLQLNYIRTILNLLICFAILAGFFQAYKKSGQQAREPLTS